MRKNCIDTGRPSPSIPPSRGGRWSAWRSRLTTFFVKWLRFSVGTSISLALAVVVQAQEGPKERVRFLDGKAELCEVVAADADGVTLRLSGIQQPLRFRWWQLASEDAARLRDAQLPRPAVKAAEAEFLVPGYRIRTTDDKVYEGVPVEGAPAGQVWLKNAEGKFVIRVESILAREDIKVDLARAYAPDEVVGILVGRIKPRTAEDYDLLGMQLIRAKLQARAVAAFRVAELLRHPESPEARMLGELIKLRERIDDLAVRKAVFQAEEQALAGEYDAAIAQVEVVEKLLGDRPDALAELKRVRTQLQEFRGLARDERIVMEGYRASEALLKAKAMDRGVSFAAARAWVEQKLFGEFLDHLRSKFNFSPEDATVQRVWERRPADAMLKHSYDAASWVVLRPEMRDPEGWWKATDDRTRYELLKGLFIEKHLTVLRAEQKSCGVCGGTGLLEQKDSTSAMCPSCQGLKGYRVLIYR